MFLSRLIYCSRAYNLTIEDISSIVEVSKKNNKSLNITGCLAYQSNTFVQVLEGRRDKITQLYNVIANDSRHTNISLLEFRLIEQREFNAWSMQHVETNGIDEAIILRYFPDGFNPEVIVQPETLLRFLLKIGS